ncbi:hypothetical protein FACS1894166_13350 [Bacilli bacterium]|nr:hypothetical protein FACS1894166_13350 [Bacilli bacterium]
MIKLTGNKKLKSVKFDNCFSYCAYDEQDKSQMKKLNKSSKLHFANTGEDKHIWNLQQIWENYMSDTPNQAVFENLAGTDLDSIELRDLVEN